MEKLLMLGTSYCAPEMIEYAKSIGVYTIATDHFPLEISKAKQVADEYWMISTDDLDALEKKCREEGITAITCGISEFNQDMALELCERLGLPNYATKKAWHFNRNKADFKAVCKKVGAPVATDYYLTDALTDEELAAVQFPVVIKPADQCSNKGVRFCYSREELIEAYRYARSVSECSTVVCERLIHGEEYIGLYAIADGEVSELGLVSSYVQPGSPIYCYMINTTVNPHISHYRDEVSAYARKVLKGVGCREGIAWLQFMHDWEDGTDYLIEMGYRLAGDLTFMPMEKLNQFNAIQWMVECALGAKHASQDLPQPQTDPFASCACSYIMWTDKAGTIAEIRGLDEIAGMSDVRVIRNTMQPGEHIEQYRPLGNILFTSKDCDAMCDMIDYINQKVAVLDENGDDLMIHFTDFETLKARYKMSLAH